MTQPDIPVCIVGAGPVGLTTAARLAEMLGCGAGTLEWNYVGLNHRGFLVELRVEGQDVLPRFLDRLEGRDFEGSPGAVIAALNGQQVGGRALTVNEAKPKTDGGGRGGSGGRGYGGGGGGGGRGGYGGGGGGGGGGRRY